MCAGWGIGNTPYTTHKNEVNNYRGVSYTKAIRMCCQQFYDPGRVSRSLMGYSSDWLHHNQKDF